MRSCAKINVFLKITGVCDGYHELASRFVLVESLYDELSFTKKNAKRFTVKGDFSCELHQNTIHKAYITLRDSLANPGVLDAFFASHVVEVEKCIKEGSGLGGGSSNAAAFLNLCNETLGLGLTLDALAKIGESVGADVPFFVYGYKSANVSGIGEVVESFDEPHEDYEVVTPEVHCDTRRVYKAFRERFFKTAEEQIWFDKSSAEVLKKTSALQANDLLTPALYLYPELQEFVDRGMYMSGSGSSFFKPVSQN